MPRIFLGLFLVCAAGAAGFVLTDDRLSAAVPADGSGRGASAVAVETAPVASMRFAETVEAVGTARARQSVVLQPSAAGRITEIGFAAGDRVAEPGGLRLRGDLQDGPTRLPSERRTGAGRAGPALHMSRRREWRTGSALSKPPRLIYRRRPLRPPGAPDMTDTARPAIRLMPKADARAIRWGAPWVYADNLVTDRRTRGLAPGTIAVLQDAERQDMALVAVNPGSKIMARIIDRDPAAVIDKSWFARRFARALSLRETLYAGATTAARRWISRGWPATCMAATASPRNSTSSATW